MHPKIDNYHIRKNVYCTVTLAWVFNTQSPDDPDSSSDEPAHFKTNVKGEKKDDRIVTPF